MSLLATFRQLEAQLPLIAILRGLPPSQATAVGAALQSSGFGLWEVPLNSPEPLQSIATMRQAYPDVLVGAGTVLTVQQVREVHAAGGQLIISPNCNPAVIDESIKLGLISLPGVLTPTEAFTALAHGAHGLKIFPAELASPAVVKALLAVLPKGTGIYPVGGITPGTMAPWLQAGATGFGIGSSLFKPGKTAVQVEVDAQTFAHHYRVAQP